jgi:branched-chain amino acid transport system substrate-binding protein
LEIVEYNKKGDLKMSNQSRKTVFLTSILLLVLLSTWGRVFAADKIKVGISDALSGHAAAWGIPKTQAMTLQFDMINEAGGVKIGDKTYKFEYVLEDDKGTSEGGAMVANKLIFRDKVDFILAVATTPPALSMGPVAQENNVLIFINGTSGPGLSPKLTWVFRPHITAYERALASTAWMIKNKPEVKRVAIYGADNEGGHFDCKTFKELIEAKTNWEIVSEDYAPFSGT